MMISASTVAVVGAVAVAVGFAGDPRPSAAAGFAAARFGAEHGHVTTTNPTALYYNPAAVALAGGTHLYLDGTLALRRATWEHATAPGERADPAGAEGANVGRAE